MQGVLLRTHLFTNASRREVAVLQNLCSERRQVTQGLIADEIGDVRHRLVRYDIKLRTEVIFLLLGLHDLPPPRV